MSVPSSYFCPSNQRDDRNSLLNGDADVDRVGQEVALGLIVLVLVGPPVLKSGVANEPKHKL